MLGGFSPALELHLGPVTGLGDGRAWKWQSCDCGYQADGKGESYGWTCQAGACVGGWGGVDSGCHPRSFRTQRAPVGVGVCVCVFVGGRIDTERMRHRGKGEAEGRGTTRKREKVWRVGRRKRLEYRNSRWEEVKARQKGRRGGGRGWSRESLTLRTPFSDTGSKRDNHFRG